MIHCPDCGPAQGASHCLGCGGPTYDLSVPAEHAQYTALQALTARAARRERGRKLVLGLGATALASGTAGLLLLSKALLGIGGLALAAALVVISLHDEDVPSTL
jgi:hypothetical protein